MRSSNDIFFAIRQEVFGISQHLFGKRIGLTRETISRLEGAKDGHRVSPKHLGWVKELRPPPEKAERFQALIAELEAALRLEWKAEEFVVEHSIGGVAAAEQAQFAAKVEEATRRAEEAARRSEQLFLEEEARHREWLQRLEELTRRSGEAVQRTEALLAAEEVRRAEVDRQWGEMLRRAEEAALRAEQARQRVEEELRAAAAREEEAARLAKEAAQREARLRERRQWFVLVAVAASALFGVLVGRASVRTAEAPRSTEWGSGAHAERSLPGGNEPSPTSEDEESADSEQSLSSGLDAGTEMAKVLKDALPMPKAGVPNQMAAPCPEGTEEINGYCWARLSLTPAQVRSGYCDYLGLYEPSAGYCRAHRIGYKPWPASRRNNNVVEPK